MYLYIYDSFLQDKKYESFLSQIEARLLELGINGKIEKLTILKNLGEMVEDGIKKGADTIVAVGNDGTLSKIISLLAPHKRVTLGFIPVGQNQRIAPLLGLTEGIKACDALSKRIIQKFDLGKVNDKYFLFSLAVPKGSVTVECDGNYRIITTDPSAYLRICNLGLIEEGKFFNPGDGFLDAVVISKKQGLNIFKKTYKKDSVLPIKEAKINCKTECLSLVIDGQTVVKTPAKVEVVPARLKIIVGKERKF